MDFLLSFIAFILPFIILFFVVAAGVKRGIDSSETGKAILRGMVEQETAKKKK